MNFRALPASLFATIFLLAPISRTAEGAEPHLAAAMRAVDDSTDAHAGFAVLAASAEREGLRPAVLGLAMRARARVLASGGTTSPILTVIDYSLPSRQRRLWVLDLARDSVLAHELVAHGRNSGGDLATQFSNDFDSHESSLGTFVTGNTYFGSHGLSLRLNGLDAGLNDQAMARAIVVHGADYVNESIGTSLGRLGRSFGCPALATDVAPRIINLIKGGSVLFAYYPSAQLEATLPMVPDSTLLAGL